MHFDGETNGMRNVGPIPPPPFERRKWFLGVPVIIGLIFVSTVYFLEGENAMLSPEDITVKNESTSDLLPTSSTPESKPKTEPESKPDLTPDPKPESKPDPKPNPKPESKPDPTKKIGGNSQEGRATSEAPVDIEKLLDFEEMLEVFEVKRQELYTQLEKDYGPETFKKLLLDRGRNAIDSHSVVHLDRRKSMRRMRRKMMLKIIKGQEAAATNQRSRNLQAEDWANITSQESRRMKDADLAGFSTYVWATGGHSATAGHGNMWRESYTAVLARNVKDIFATVGLNFIGRNHAMGATGSAPEIAMCVKEVFGTDIDVLAWDAGMLDGKYYGGMSQYFMRAALLPNRPAMVSLHTAGHKGRRNVVVELEKMGVAALTSDGAPTGDLPDTMGLSDAEIAKMPKFVRKFKCGKQIENGNPGCGGAKFNTTLCSGKYRVSWHPGWKWHAITGNMIAMWLSFVVEDALQELIAAKNSTHFVDFVDKLRADEETDFKLFMSAALPKASEEVRLPRDIDREVFLRGPNFCHTARLPAEIRHLGILTESKKVGADSYDKGRRAGDMKNFVPDGSMPLVYDPGERQSCPEPLNKDYKDWFHVQSSFGWSQLTLPTDAEVEAYGTGAPLRGIISVCFRHDGEFGLRPGAFEVNGMMVTNFTKQRRTCKFLSHANGHIFEPNSDGRFEIRARTNGKFSSFGIWIHHIATNGSKWDLCHAKDDQNQVQHPH